MARPTLEEESIKNHKKAMVRLQNSMAKNVGKAGDIITWLLEDIHKSVNPANEGKKDRKGNEIYQPTKYKENTQITVAKEFISNSKEFNKAQEELAQLEGRISEKASQEVEDDFEIQISLSSEPESDTSKLN